MTADEARDFAAELTEKAKNAIAGYVGCEKLLLLADYLITRKA